MASASRPRITRTRPSPEMPRLRSTRPRRVVRSSESGMSTGWILEGVGRAGSWGHLWMCGRRPSVGPDPFEEQARHLGRSLELQPVAGSREHLQPILSRHVPVRKLGLRAAQRRVLVTPYQLSGDGDRERRRRRPEQGLAAQVGAIVVEPGGEPARPREGPDEPVYLSLGDHVRAGGPVHATEAAEVAFGQYFLRLVRLQEQLDIGGPLLLIRVVP